MLRTALSRVGPHFSRVSACRFSAAAIPAPNPQPEVHHNKVEYQAMRRLEHSHTLLSACQCCTLHGRQSLTEHFTLLSCIYSPLLLNWTTLSSAQVSVSCLKHMVKVKISVVSLIYVSSDRVELIFPHLLHTSWSRAWTHRGPSIKCARENVKRETLRLGASSYSLAEGKCRTFHHTSVTAYSQIEHCKSFYEIQAVDLAFSSLFNLNVCNENLMTE